MNWSIYEKRKKLIIWAFVINILLVLPILLFLSLDKLTEQSRRLSKDNVRLKNIATAVAMYFSDCPSGKYPKCPKSLDLDGSLIDNAAQNSWKQLSNTSPYYFFPYENTFYEGNRKKPLAVRKTPLFKTNLCSIVFEDGHVEHIRPQVAQNMISFYTFLRSIHLYLQNFQKPLTHLNTVHFQFKKKHS